MLVFFPFFFFFLSQLTPPPLPPPRLLKEYLGDLGDLILKWPSSPFLGKDYISLDGNECFSAHKLALFLKKNSLAELSGHVSYRPNEKMWLVRTGTSIQFDTLFVKRCFVAQIFSLFWWTYQTLALQLPDLLFVWLKTKLDFNLSYFQIKVDCCSSTLSTQKGTRVNFHIILCQIWVCTWDTPHTMIFISITDSSTLTICRNFIINVN